METWEKEYMRIGYDPTELEGSELDFYNGFKYAIECCESAFANMPEVEDYKTLRKIEREVRKVAEDFVIDWLRRDLLHEVTVSLMESNEKYCEE